MQLSACCHRAWRNGVPGDDVDPCERGCLVPFGLDVDENGDASFSDGGEEVEDGGFRPIMPRLAPAWREERVHDAFGRVVRIIYALEGPFGMAWSVGVRRVWDGSRLLHEHTSSGCFQRVWAPGVLLYPLSIPLLIAGVKGSAVLFNPDLPGGPADWLALMIAFDALFLVLGRWLFGEAVDA